LDDVKLLLLDTFDLESVVFQLLSHFLTFFKVIKAILLVDARVLRDLGAYNVSVVPELTLLLLLHLSFLLLVFLLALNDAQEIVTLSLGLVGQSALAFHELLLAGDFECVSLLACALLLSNLLASGSTLALLEGTLGTESINLRLSIGGLLLHLSEAGDLLFFLFLKTAFFKGLSDFTLNLLLVVTDDFLLFVEFALSKLGLLGEGNFVSGLDLRYKTKVLSTLVISGFDLTLTLGFNLTGHLFLFLDELLALLNTLDLTLLDLVHNDKGTLAASLATDSFTLLSDFKALKSLDFHKEIKFTLLFKPFLFKLLVLIQLSVTDRYNF
jgi:hypothetical protein